MTEAVAEVVEAAKPDMFSSPDQKPKGRIAFDTESNLGIYVSNTPFMNNTWTYDAESNTWKRAQDKPFDFAVDAVYDSQADRLIVYDESGKTWAFDTNANTWTPAGC